MFKCNTCEYVAKTKHNLKQHINSLHLLQKYPCQLCKYQATQLSSLNRHTKKVHEPAPENVTCAECNTTLKPSSLASHRKSFHSGENPRYNCKVCTYQTFWKPTLKKHTINVHQKSRKI